MSKYLVKWVEERYAFIDHDSKEQAEQYVEDGLTNGDLCGWGLTDTFEGEEAEREYAAIVSNL